MSASHTHKALLIARQKVALRQAAGAWRDKDHPELKVRAVAWVKKMRSESEARFKKQFPVFAVSYGAATVRS